MVMNALSAATSPGNILLTDVLKGFCGAIHCSFCSSSKSNERQKKLGAQKSSTLWGLQAVQRELQRKVERGEATSSAILIWNEGRRKQIGMFCLTDAVDLRQQLIDAVLSLI